MLQANHTSFFDTLLFTATLPREFIVNTRTYMGAHLFKLPVLCAICKGCGHFPVYFTGPYVCCLLLPPR